MWPVVLLAGATGTGKTFAARRIYETLKETKCLDGKFVHLNCGEFGANDMAGSLFGIKGGVFTGVPNDREGAIGVAKDGICFLDEIGTLPMELQPQLLTLLDNGEYRLHGDNSASERSRCRFIFGTNENLLKACGENRFRFDLYCRINGMMVDMPSLSDRIGRSGGEALVRSIIDEFGERKNRLSFTRKAESAFAAFARQHAWRGNYREVGRFFNLLATIHADEDCGRAVSASAMRRACAALEKEELGAEALEGLATAKDRTANPQLDGIAGLCAKDRVCLEFAFDCAAAANNQKQAAERFFAGGHQRNASTSFVRFLEKFGFRFDLASHGHIVCTDKADRQTSLINRK